MVVPKGKLRDNNAFLFELNIASRSRDFTRQSFMTAVVCLTDFHIMSVRTVLLHNKCLIFVG